MAAEFPALGVRLGGEPEIGVPSRLLKIADWDSPELHFFNFDAQMNALAESAKGKPFALTLEGDDRLLVIVAHPDDETLSAGILLSRSKDVRIVHVTDGAPRDPAFVARGFSGTPPRPASSISSGVGRPTGDVRRYGSGKPNVFVRKIATSARVTLFPGQ